jgi:hypothetical protein
MPEEIIPQQIEVQEPAVKTGTVEMFNKAGFNNPAPDKLKRVLTAMRYTFVGLITMVSGTDLFTGYQSKVISFSLGVAVLICGAIELGTGVKSIDNEK